MLLSLLFYSLALMGVLVGARLITAGWWKIFTRLAGNQRTRLDTMMFQESRRPVYYAMLFLGMYGVTRQFYAQPLLAGIGFRDTVDNVFFTVIVLAVAHAVMAVTRATLRWYKEEVGAKTHSDLDDAFIHLANSVGKVVVYFIAGTMVLARFGITITSLLATAGVASLALAFAAQETLGNMLAGFTIMIDRPFRIGDRIELSDGSTGDCIEIGLRSTKVLSFDNTLIVIPNKTIASAKVVNHSYPDPKVKVRVELGVDYNADIARVKQILQEVFQTHSKVLADPPVATFFTGFGESTLMVMAVGWITDYRDKMTVLDELNMEIKRRFALEGVQIPFPQRDVHLYKH